MSQNVSTAVMARRREAPDGLDFFPTPPWATRALVEHVLWSRRARTVLPEGLTRPRSVWDPAAGQGHMVRPLKDYFDVVFASDIHDYDRGFLARDFLLPGPSLYLADAIVANPPFRLARQFVERGLAVANRGVCVLVRTAFLEGKARWRDLFATHPPAIVAPFAERVPIVKGRVDPKASSATSYCWMVFSGKGRCQAPIVAWIPPCRAQLEKPGDYDS